MRNFKSTALLGALLTVSTASFSADSLSMTKERLVDEAFKTSIMQENNANQVDMNQLNKEENRMR